MVVIVYITRCEMGMSESRGVIVYITREEVPPILLFLERKLEGLWVFLVDPPCSPRQGAEGWQVDWANPTLEASYDKSKRGGFLTRRGGAWGGRRSSGHGMGGRRELSCKRGGPKMPRRGSTFSRRLAPVPICAKFYFHFLL